MHYKKVSTVKSLIRRIILTMLFTAYFTALCVKVEGSVNVIGQRSTGCVISFKIDDLSVKDISVRENKYKLVDFNGGLWFANQGEPNLPSAAFFVGIPETGKISVKVTAAGEEVKSNINILPVPFEHEENGFAVTDYREGGVYKSGQPFPSMLYKVDPPGFIRDNRVVKITIYPVQYNPEQKIVKIFRTMQIDVNWQGSVKNPEKIKSSKSLLNKVLVNSNQAKSFIISRNMPVIKKRSITETGQMYKIPISSSGIYEISGTFLKNNNIDIEAIDVSTIKMYNNGGRELPRSIEAERPDNFIELPLLITGIDDGSFDESDKIIFFARGTTGVEYDSVSRSFTHYLNRYTTQNIYWLRFNDGKEGRRIKTKHSPEESSETSLSFIDHYYFEQDRIPMFRGGMSWYNTELSSAYPVQHYTFFAHDPVEPQAASIVLRVKGGSIDNHYFTINLNGSDIGSIQVSNTQIGIKELPVPNGLLSGENALYIRYSGSGEGAKSYIDWYEVNYQRRLNADSGALLFFSPDQKGSFTYKLNGSTEKPIVFDVTDAREDSLVDVTASSSDWIFSDYVHEYPIIYAASDTSTLLQPSSIVKAEPIKLRSQLNSADMIIITAEDFFPQAEEIAAIHRDTDTLSVFVTTINQVYDEFGWGLKDPVAIRDFVRYAYLFWQKKPVYLLLFGGGHFDYRNLLTESMPNKIPPFEYDGSSLQQSRAADDFYCYVSGNDFYPDIAVGRIPAWSTLDADVVDEKIKNYLENPSFGTWKGLVTFLGDDEKAATGKENETTHIVASEAAAEYAVPARYNKKKIYLTEYPESYTTQRRLRPKAREALLDQINRGTLFLNFIGHGNKTVWTHEWVFHRDIDIPLLENKGKLPVFYGATCAFAQYDDPEDRSFAEALLTAENKGGIASIGASRFCSSVPNEALNRSFLGFLFKDTLSVGLSLQFAKLLVSYTSNNELYHLLGDPALHLAVPKYNAKLISMEPDTFKALSIVHVKGQVEKGAAIWNSFNGSVEVSAFDSKRDVTYKTMYDTEIKYKLAGNTIFKGEGKVKNGIFNVDFVVPKDISYGGDAGRLYFYFTNDGVDGSGYRDTIAVGGSSFIKDGSGPDIRILFNGYENFMSGDMISENPQLIAEINDDKTGVNITGEIGHKITMTVDDAEQKDLTEYFNYEENNYLSGKIVYSLKGLDQGVHRIKIKAWDNANNSSTTTVECKVVPANKLFFEDVLPYPNPFTDNTTFTFKINMEADVVIKIFTVSGRMIKRIDSIWAEPGFNMVEWDGLDTVGDRIANGVYLYKLIAKAHAAEGDLESSFIGKVMKMR